jgi:hypothetical protein
MASRKMERHSATRKTPLIRAPRVSARCHYSRLDKSLDGSYEATYSVCVRLRVGLLTSDLDCPQSYEERDDIVQLCVVSASAFHRNPDVHTI